MVDVIVIALTAEGISAAFHATVIADHRSKIGAPGYGKLAARHTCVAQYDDGKRVPATICAISDAIRWAEEILKEIDERLPVK